MKKYTLLLLIVFSNSYGMTTPLSEENFEENRKIHPAIDALVTSLAKANDEIFNEDKESISLEKFFLEICNLTNYSSTTKENNIKFNK